MKMMKRLLLALLAVMMMLTCTVAQAAEVSLTLQEAIVTDAGEIKAVLHTAVNKNLQAADFEVLLDTQVLPVQSVESYGKTGTSWIILLDEGAVGAGESVKELMNKLIDVVAMTDGNMAIINTSATEITLSEDLTALRAVIDSDVVKYNQNKKDLNAAIVSALNFLETNNSVKTRANLVVISSGKRTENGQTTTDAKVQEALAASNVTLYAVAYDNKTPSADFNALAQSSKAGVAVSLTKTTGDRAKEAAAEACGVIEGNENQFYVLTMQPAQTGKTLSVKLNSENASKTGTIDLTAEQQNTLDAILNPAPVETAAPTAEPTAEPTATPFPGPVEPITWTMVYIGGGVLALILIVTIILLVVKGKKNKAVVDDVPASVDPALETDTVRPQPGVEAFEPTVPNVVPVMSGIRVTLSQVGLNEQQVYTADMQDSLIIGRDPSKARMIVCPNDKKVSGEHLRLTYQAGVMTAQDVSRNGTLVNGVRITASTVLHENDRITMGVTTLLITWQRL